MLRSGFGPGLLRVVGGYHEGVGNAIIDLHLTYPAPVTLVSTVSLGPKLEPAAAVHGTAVSTVGAPCGPS